MGEAREGRADGMITLWSKWFSMVQYRVQIETRLSRWCLGYFVVTQGTFPKWQLRCIAFGPLEFVRLAGLSQLGDGKADGMSTDKDAVGLGVSLTMLAIIFGGAAIIGSYSCSAKAEKMDLKSDWGPLQGCMVKTPNGWRDIKMLREVE